MNVNAYLEWRAVIDKHFGSLAGFSDIRTVKIQLDDLHKRLADHEVVANAIQDEVQREDFNAFFESEVTAAKKAIAELEQWMEDQI